MAWSYSTSLHPSCLPANRHPEAGREGRKGLFPPWQEEVKPWKMGDREESSQVQGKPPQSRSFCGLNAWDRTGFISPVDGFPHPECPSTATLPVFHHNPPHWIREDRYTPSLNLGWPEAPLLASQSKTFKPPATTLSGELASSEFIPLEAPQPLHPPAPWTTPLLLRSKAFGCHVSFKAS